VGCKQYPVVVHVGKMEEKDLLTLMYKHHPEIEKRNGKTREEVEILLHDFFEAIDGHTMTVEMAAAIMRDGRKKIAEINEAIFTCNRTIGTDHSREKKITAFEHLSTLYDLASISKDEEKILSAACLIAPQVGVDCEELQDLLNIDDDYEAMDHLVSLTFLRLDEKDTIRMHPLFSDVFYKKANVAEKADDNELLIRYLLEKGERIDLLNMDSIEAYESLMEYLLEKRETAFSNIEFGEFLYDDVLFSMSDCLDGLKKELYTDGGESMGNPIQFRLWLCYQQCRYSKVLIRIGEKRGLDMEENKKSLLELQYISKELKKLLDENPELS
jgi:hypothetical protein